MGLQKPPLECSLKKAVLKYLLESPVLESLFCNFIKKRLQHRCFPLNITTFLRTPILKNMCKHLLLDLSEKDNYLKLLMQTVQAVITRKTILTLSV